MPWKRIVYHWEIGPLEGDGHGRDGRCQPPPVQIPACAANAPGSSLGFWRRSGDKAAGVSF